MYRVVNVVFLTIQSGHWEDMLMLNSILMDRICPYIMILEKMAGSIAYVHALVYIHTLYMHIQTDIRIYTVKNG